MRNKITKTDNQKKKPKAPEVQRWENEGGPPPTGQRVPLSPEQLAPQVTHILRNLLAGWRNPDLESARSHS